MILSSLFSIFIAILVLGVLITVHEAGHFIVAKLCGVGVLEFALGFGKKIYSKRIGETLYSLRAVPLGGYVRMVGETPAEVTSVEKKSAENDPDRAESDEIEARLTADRSKWFLEKGYFSKVAIVAAGPIANFLFAFVVAVTSYYVFGFPVPTNDAVIGDVLPKQPAEEAGLRAGDRILSIDGKEISKWEEIHQYVSNSDGQKMTFRVKRPDIESELEFKVKAKAENSEFAYIQGIKPDNKGRIGIIVNFELKPLSLGQSVVLGATRVVDLTILTVRGLWGMIVGAISTDNLGGPITILEQTTKNSNRGMYHHLEFVVLISVSHDVLNLLPVPVLDGGHIAIFTIEAIKGGPISIRIQELATQIGLAFLILLSAFALGNDIIRLL